MYRISDRKKRTFSNSASYREVRNSKDLPLLGFIPWKEKPLHENSKMIRGSYFYFLYSTFMKKIFFINTPNFCRDYDVCKFFMIAANCLLFLHNFSVLNNNLPADTIGFLPFVKTQVQSEKGTLQVGTTWIEARTETHT